MELQAPPRPQVSTTVAHEDYDEAYKYLKHNATVELEVSLIDLKTIRRTVDWRIVPIMFACYTMQFFDKIILNVSVSI